MSHKLRGPIDVILRALKFGVQTVKLNHSSSLPVGEWQVNNEYLRNGTGFKRNKQWNSTILDEAGRQINRSSTLNIHKRT